MLPKPFNFHSKNPSSWKPCDNNRNYRFTTDQVNTEGKHRVFLHEQLSHLHTGMLCTYPVLPSSVHVCIYFEWFPLWLFLELDFLLWNVVLEVSGPVYNLITRNYANNFNMNFLEVSLLL